MYVAVAVGNKLLLLLLLALVGRVRSIVDGGIDAYDRSVGSVDHHRSGSDQFCIDIGLRHGSSLDPLSGVHYGDGTDQREQLSISGRSI